VQPLVLAGCSDTEEALQGLDAESHSPGVMALLSKSVASWMRGWRPFTDDGRAADSSHPLPAHPLPSLRSCIAWHPYSQRCAVSVGSSGVQVADLFEVSGATETGHDARPMCWQKPLHHDRQREVSCLAFQPCRGNALAVGCRGGVCLWGAADERDVWRPSHGQTTRHEAADAIWLERNHGQWPMAAAQ
jgi:hypothetical protein